jgi:hypothetical protein
MLCWDSWLFYLVYFLVKIAFFSGCGIIRLGDHSTQKRGCVCTLHKQAE